MLRFCLWLLPLVLLSSGFANCGTTAMSHRQNVYVSVIPCAADSGVRPVVHVSNLRGRDERLYPSTSEPIAGGYRVHFTVATGHYRVRVSGKNCNSAFRLTVQPAHDRHVSTATTPPISFVDYNFYGSIAGTLPFPAYGVTLVFPNGAQRPISMDDGAFYAENVPAGKMTLRISLWDALQADLPITMSCTGTQAYVIDVPAAAVRAELGYSLANGTTEIGKWGGSDKPSLNGRCL